MSSKLQRFLFYLLIVLLPTQLARHFFFKFSLISGIRSDYLAPTVYLTDVIVGLIVMIEFYKKFKTQNLKSKITNKKKQFYGVLTLMVFYLLFSSLFVAQIKWVAFYRLIKIIEFILLGWVIVRIKPDLIRVFIFLSCAVLYSSLIALNQFFLDKSIGGILYFLGERSFYASTPGIATFSLFGREFLRPYATFPHPNVLGGFLATILPAIIFILKDKEKKIGEFIRSVFLLSLITGLFTLFLTFSRASWIVAVFGFVLVIFNKKMVVFFQKENKKLILLSFYTIVLLSVISPFLLSHNLLKTHQNIKERVNLLEAGFKMVSENLFFGVGLNNSIIKQSEYIIKATGIYIFQPIHNIYLLILTETGLIGLALFLFSIYWLFQTSLNGRIVLSLVLIQIFLLGLFDHYFFTLQQGQLLFTLFASLAFVRKNT